MKILIAGAGAIGSNLTSLLVPDLKGQHEITILDQDVVEDRNIEAGTQFYSSEQVGMSKVEALQYNIYKNFQREIEIINNKVETIMARELYWDLIIDCFDNYEARFFLQQEWQLDVRESKRNKTYYELLHLGFSDQFTFAIEWAENYKVPTDITSGFDICEAAGASSFIKLASSVASLVIQEFLKTGKKMEVVGSRFSITEIK